MSDRLTLNQFGLGLMAAFIAKGIDSIHVYNEANFHECFKKAFEVVKEELGEENLDHFTIITGSIYGTSGAVDDLLYYWGTTWASYERGWWHLKMTSHEKELFLNKLPGGRDLYLKAAEAFLEQYHTPSAS